MIFITSDTHFGHNRGFMYEPRGYTSIEDHDKDLIAKWNSIVGPEDTVYHLGDMMLGDNDYGLDCIRHLNGNIILILGNHDTNTRIKLYQTMPNILIDGYADIIKYQKFTFYLSHYPTMTGNLEAESLYKTVINLYGHTHQKTNFYQDIPFMYHVGIDSHNGYPVPLDTILIDCKKKVNEYKEML